MITSHLLPEAAFSELAQGAGGPGTMRLLGDAQRSKHLMLLHAIAQAAAGPGVPGTGPAAFRAACDQLARIQVTAPGAVGWLLGLPHLGGWAHDALIRLEQGTAADFGHFASLVAAAAVRAGLSFELDVPVRDGRVRLPGLGSLRVADEPYRQRIQVRVGERRRRGRVHIPVPACSDRPARIGWARTPLPGPSLAVAPRGPAERVTAGLNGREAPPPGRGSPGANRR